MQERLLHLEDAAGGVYPGPELADVERPGDEIVRPRFEAVRLHRPVGVGRHQDEIGVFLAGELAEGAAEVGAVHARHLPVAEHHADAGPLVGHAKEEGLRGVGHRHDVEIHPRQDRGQQLSLRRAVVDDEHAHALRGQRGEGRVALHHRSIICGLRIVCHQTVKRPLKTVF